MEYSIKNELAQALQNVTAKDIDGTDYSTIGEMLHGFNAKYTCIVTFTTTPANATVVVKQGDKVIEAETDGKFALKEGNYTYTISAAGYFSLADQALAITNADETTGSKTVTKTLTKYCVVTFETTPEDAAIIVYDNTSATVDAEEDGTYNLKEGSYTYDASADGYTSKTAQSLTTASGDVTTGTKTVTVTLEEDAS